MGGTTVTGSSKKARKTYLRIVQNVQLTGSVPKIAQRESPIIGFSEADARRLHHPHDDALVVSIRIEDYNMPSRVQSQAFGPEFIHSIQGSNNYDELKHWTWAHHGSNNIHTHVQCNAIYMDRPKGRFYGSLQHG